jgi:sugar phosphate permease
MIQAERYQFVILAVSSFSFAVTWIARTAYSPLIEEIRSSLALSYSEAGLVMSLFWMGYSIVQIPSGILSDKFGVRSLSAVTLFLTGVFMYLQGNSSSFIEFSAYNFLAGLTSGFMWCLGNSSIVRWFSEGDRTIAIGIFSSSSSAGVLVASTISPHISVVFGSWRWSFWILSAPAFVSSLLALIFMKESPKTKDLLSKSISRSAFSIREALGKISKSQEFWLLTIAISGLKLLIGAATTWTPTFLIGVFGVTATLAGIFASFSHIISIFSGPSAGFVSDRILKRKNPILLTSIATASILLFLVGFSETWSMWTSLCLIYLGFFFGHMGFGLNPSILAELFPLKYAGTAIGFLNFSSGIGNIMGPWLFGAIRDNTGGYVLSWVAVSTIAFAASLPLMQLISHEKHEANNKI